MPPRKSLPVITKTPDQQPSRTSRSTLKKGSKNHQSPSSSPDPLAPSPFVSRTRGGNRRKSTTLDAPNGNNINGEGGLDGKEEENDEIEKTEEEKLEAWQDFAAEHYEMVEQLPLELHRNFRLLRELDDGCQDQMGKLQQQIRTYISARLDLLQKVTIVSHALENEKITESRLAEKIGLDDKVNGEKEEGVSEEAEFDGANDKSHSQINPVIDNTTYKESEGEKKQTGQTATPPPMPSDSEPLAFPISDGEGGLVVPENEETEEPIPPRNEFPSEPPNHGVKPSEEKDDVDVEMREEEEEVEETVEDREAGPDEVDKPTATDPGEYENVEVELSNETMTAVGQNTNQVDEEPDLVGTAQEEREKHESQEQDNNMRKSENLASRHLPEIGRLSREIVRTCEEKLALAVGAYNSIDRHIRALDSALSAQETSLILGLRTDTLPSSNLTQALGLPGDLGTIENLGQEADGEGIMIGVGGGETANRRGRKKKGKKGKEEEIVVGVPQQENEEVDDADPNEPRYCYCNRVSFGKMVGCDNDECPIEWFHLPCVGLQTEPTGTWYCDICKPKIGLGMGGAGTVQPDIVDKRPVKRRKK